MLARDAKEEIRQRLDLAEIVGEVVALKPAGRGQLKGLCPFHSERTPSFHVHQDRGFFYCFGCQAKGDIFDFVMRTQGVSFSEAMQLLGHRSGVEVTPPTPGERRRGDLYDVNSLAHSFFVGCLRDPALGRGAREYLAGRGLSEETIERFGLGFAPDSWDGLLRHALTKGYRDQDLLDAGLLSENERGRRYDRFRNRLIFPIRDPLGRIVGFAGRVLDDSLPKYLNTPETDVFHKGELLYGLDLARAEIRSRGECIVVEGYMDVIALHQAGVNWAVAASGATLTAQQADLLSRLDVANLYLAFDADSAGQKAVLAGLDQSVGRQFLVRAVEVPFGKDPADAVLGGHLDEFMTAVRAGRSEVEYRFETVTARYDPKTTSGQKAILTELLPVLRPRSIFDPVATEMRRLVVDRLGMDEKALDNWIGSNRQRRMDDTQLRGLKRAGTKELGRAAVVESEIMALLLLDPPRLEARLNRLVAALPAGHESLLHEFAEVCGECGFDTDRILLRYRERSEGSLLWERLFHDTGEADDLLADLDSHVDRSLSLLREIHLDAEKEGSRSRLLARMEELRSLLADSSLPPDRLRQLYDELAQLGSLLSAREAERRLRVPPRMVRRKRT